MDKKKPEERECSIIGCECPYQVIECAECAVYRTLELVKKLRKEKKDEHS